MGRSYFFVSILMLAASQAAAIDCNTDCKKKCRILGVVEPGCHISCESKKKAACVTGVRIPAPPHPTEIAAAITMQTCVASFQQVMGLADASCSSWGGRNDDAEILLDAKEVLVELGVLSDADFDRVLVQWCPLVNAGGIVPDRNRVFVDVSYKSAHMIDLATLVAHEMKHVRQYRELGTDNFKCKYSMQFKACGGCQNNGHPLERDAYAFGAFARRAMEDHVADLTFVYGDRPRSRVNSPPPDPVPPPPPPPQREKRDEPRDVFSK